MATFIWVGNSHTPMSFTLDPIGETNALVVIIALAPSRSGELPIALEGQDDYLPVVEVFA